MNSDKQKFKPVRTCDMDMTMWGFPSVSKTDSARKTPKYSMPVRICDMDPALFVDIGEQIKRKPVRKQLWSGEKKNSRYTTNFKPSKNIRKSVIAKPLMNSTGKVLEEVEHKKQERKFNIPTIKVDKQELETRPKLKLPNKYQYSNKIAADVSNNKFDEVLKRLEQMELQNKEILARLTKLENKEVYNEEILARLTKLENIELYNKDILDRLIILQSAVNNRYTNKLSIEDQIYEENQEEKCDLIKTENKPIKNVNENTPDIKTPLKLSPNYTSNSTPEVNDLIDEVLSRIEINDDRKALEIKTNEEIPEPEILELSDSPLIINKRKNNNKLLIDSHKKFINKFEILESKLKYGSPMSDELSLSDTDSPALIKKDINWLMNDKNDLKSPLFRSLSTSSVVSQSTKKSVTFKSQTDLHSDPVDNYNEMRKNVNFLCTPKNTRTVSNLMTPSVQNSQKKLLSRRIQSQLLLLE